MARPAEWDRRDPRVKPGDDGLLGLGVRCGYW